MGRASRAFSGSSIEEEAFNAARIRSGKLDPLPRPPETRRIALANQKGGVGKTTTAVNLAWAMSLQGMRVLVVDLDPQGNASTALGAEHSMGTPSTYEVMLGLIEPREAIIQHAENPNLYCMPATIDLAGAEMELASSYRREYRVRQMLDEDLTKEYDLDYIFIDCPPSLGLLTVNALTAADEILIPIQCEYYALEGVLQLTNNVKMIQQDLNRRLVISAVLLTMADRRTNLSGDVEADVRATFGEIVLKQTIPRNVRVAEAPSYNQTVLEYEPGSPGATSYLAAARELGTQLPARNETSDGDDDHTGRHYR